MAITNVVIPIDLGDSIKPHHFVANKYDVDATTLVSSDAPNKVTIGADGKLKVTESLITVDSIGVNGSNLELKYTNESSTQQTITMPTADLCASCAACIDMSSTISYTVATVPATGGAGQIIYVSDLGSGTLQFWQVGTNSWQSL